MGYQMPIVCKEIYLPLNYDFINDLSGKTFKYFAEEYKKEYGIDLHDIFELGKEGGSYCVKQKTISKIYGVGFQNDSYPFFDNVVMPAILECAARTKANENMLFLGIVTRGSTGSYYSGFGFALQFHETNLAPTSIDELGVYLSEI